VPYIGLVDFKVVVVEHVAVVLHGDREGPWGRDALMLRSNEIILDFFVTLWTIHSSIDIVCASEAHVQSASMRKILEVVVLALLAPVQGDKAPVMPHVALNPLNDDPCMHRNDKMHQNDEIAFKTSIYMHVHRMHASQ
jgi:hypothetical protein